MNNINKKMTQEEEIILEGAISVILFSALLGKEEDAEIDVEIYKDDVGNVLDAMINNAAKNEEYEFCEKLLTTKNKMNRKNYNLSKFICKKIKEQKNAKGTTIQ